ncbi:MAG: ribonuclease E/G, partial [Allosphingosinicella sp.]
ALVAVDVNSGRSTRERHIEETALRTNLEACDEIGRQLRLRDLAGLIVIDFIDMENARNQAQVERRLKEAMKSDRARVQLGRISTFGLLELSRQRLRPSLFETSFTVCAFCAGTGVRRTTESTALSIFRRIEQEGVNGDAGQITVKVPTAVAFYLLNNKRRALLDMEQRFGMTIFIAGDDTLIPPDFEIYPSGERAPCPPEKKASAERPLLHEAVGARAEPEADAEADAVPEVEAETVLAGEIEEQEEPTKRGRRRRPRRRKRAETEVAVEPASEAAAEAAPESNGEAALEAGSESVPAEPLEDDEEDEDEEGEEFQAGDDEQQDDEQARLAKKRRRRGKRGGRRRARRPVEEPAGADAGADADETLEVAPLPAAGPLMPAVESAHLADVSEAPLSGDSSAFDAEGHQGGEADRDAERAEADETPHEAEVAHEAVDEREREQEPEQGRAEVDMPEAYLEETPDKPELASLSAAADWFEPPAHQEAERQEANRFHGEGQDFERP